MGGLLRIAYELLVNDRAKYAALLVGITFVVFLMIEMTSPIPLPDYVLDEVRSLPGVKYAVPLYSGGALLKLRDGAYQSVNIIGLDDTTLFGRPALRRRPASRRAKTTCEAVMGFFFPSIDADAAATRERYSPPTQARNYRDRFFRPRREFESHRLPAPALAAPPGSAAFRERAIPWRA
jgi:hypothetical protein